MKIKRNAVPDLRTIFYSRTRVFFIYFLFKAALIRSDFDVLMDFRRTLVLVNSNFFFFFNKYCFLQFNIDQWRWVLENLFFFFSQHIFHEFQIFNSKKEPGSLAETSAVLLEEQFLTGYWWHVENVLDSSDGPSSSSVISLNMWQQFVSINAPADHRTEHKPLAVPHGPAGCVLTFVNGPRIICIKNKW